jgi:MFS family permease
MVEPGPPRGMRGYRLLHLLEPQRPERVRESRLAWALVVGTVCIGAFMGQLDASIVTVALPGISHDLHVSAAAASWVSLLYLITLVGLVAPVGMWADAIGRKALYVGGFAVFTVATVGCAFAPDLAVLCACRVAQGAGAALLQANSVALVAAAAGRDRLVRAVGVQATAQALGLALGPAVGGLLVAAGGWRLVFLVNVPAGVIGLVTGLVLLPRSRDLAARRTLPARSLGLLVVGVAGTLLGLSELAHAPVVAGVCVALGLGSLTLLARAERTDRPLFDRGLLAERRFTGGLAAGAGAYALLFGLLVAVPYAVHEDAARTGLLLAALPTGLGLATLTVGRRLTDPRPGLALAVVGAVALAALDPRGWALAGLLALIGVGIGLFTPANNGGVMRCARADQVGGASGLLNTARGLGTAVGTAVAAVSVAGGLRVSVAALAAIALVGLIAAKVAPRP